MPEPITLQVGERTFKTDKLTLLEIPYFKGFFSEAIGSKPGSDGAYFVDINGDVFEHVLNYARHRTFPLFWTQAEGFDYTKYNLLAQQADFLNLDRMVSWIKNQGFTKAVVTETTLALVQVNTSWNSSPYRTTVPHVRIIECSWDSLSTGDRIASMLIETKQPTVHMNRLVDA